jgi:diaminopimelate decarboxylase
MLPYWIPGSAGHPLSPYLDLSGNELQLEGVPIGHIIAEHRTPFYVYSERVLNTKLKLLRDAFPKEFCFFYSVKANPNPSLAALLVANNCGLEIASGGEFALALRAGCAADRMLFAGPGKGVDELEEVLLGGIGEIHLESLAEADRVGEICRRIKRRGRVAIRVNPGGDVQGGAMRMGGKAAPFGVDEEQLQTVVDHVLAIDELDFQGLHFYLGTQILDYAVLARQYRRALQISRQVAEKLNKPLATVDFGGGLGIPYFAGETELDIERLRPELEAMVQEIRRDPAFAGTRLVIEPGRFLVGEAGVYVTQVRDVKVSRGKKFVVVDGGMNHHLAASGNLGQVIKRNFPLRVLNRLNEPECEPADVVGPLCTPLDVLARDLILPRIEAGDLIGVFQSGAYARTASPLGFLSYPSPAEILIKKGQARLIRRRGTCGDLINDLPPELEL